MIVNADLEQAPDHLLDPRCHYESTVLERPFILCSWNGATVLLHNCLLNFRDPNDVITLHVVVVCQVDNQLLKTTPCDEETAVLLGPSYHIEGGEVPNPTGIRDEPVVEGLETQDDAPVPCHQLRGGHLIMAQRQESSSVFPPGQVLPQYLSHHF